MPSRDVLGIVLHLLIIEPHLSKQKEEIELIANAQMEMKTVIAECRITKALSKIFFSMRNTYFV